LHKRSGSREPFGMNSLEMKWAHNKYLVLSKQPDEV